ncbi:phospholipase C [Streptacidiphilus melanogenes]|uniref:phospholipase C n=1 Tax=Streptacidiphilus melanogenes TaxID=411235 RepID=UPI0005AB4C3F|nr:alkaline phosphatase family protein [Streptacidiphilus melanogenes]
MTDPGRRRDQAALDEGAPTDVANLDKIDHVVVLMLENRSFDHMLGHLSLGGGRPEIDGLHPGLANEYQGRGYPVHHLDVTALGIDPDHTAAAVDVQIAGGEMSGFVAAAAAGRPPRAVADGTVAAVMGYYDGADLPVHDHLAEHFAVCDRWFASVPGSTWPNRLYALCGSAAGSRDELPPHVPPLYRLPSFVRHLDAHEVSWRWYSFDPGTLRLADPRYRMGHHQQFGYFSKSGLPWKSALDLGVDSKTPSFLEDAAAGGLRSVSWIDPSFTSFNPLGLPLNDDHPTADVKDGQDLVLAAYDALASGPLWERTLLLVVYDEHGGFYDHVPPPTVVDDDPEMFGRLGVRVPAIVVSPWVEPRAVSHTVFDHTSIIKTILQRFCPTALSGSPSAKVTGARLGPQYPGTRVARASHLGELLTRTTPRPAPARDTLVRRAEARAAEEPTTRRANGARPPSDLQVRIQAAAHALRSQGHPPLAP